jgi:hypothetical protein
MAENYRYLRARVNSSDATKNARNLECGDNGGVLDSFAFRQLRIQGGVALRLPPHSTYAFWTRRKGLGFAGARVFRQHQFEGVGGFDAALLLHFINPIGYGLNHFARSLRGRVSLRRWLLLTHSLVLLDDFYSFLF